MKNATHLSAMLSMGSVQLVLHLTPTSILCRAMAVLDSNSSKRQQVPITTETESLHNRFCSIQKKDGFYVTKLTYILLLFS